MRKLDNSLKTRNIIDKWHHFIDAESIKIIQIQGGKYLDIHSFQNIQTAKHVLEKIASTFIKQKIH